MEAEVPVWLGILITVFTVINVGCVMFMAMLSVDQGEDHISVKDCIGIQLHIWEELECELTKTGLVILETLVTLVILPVMLLFLVIAIVSGVCRMLWAGFKYVFKREEESD